ncbi:hypothetical protein JP75_19830 [Devosia riboflavina]|uniref:Uncharacterized protein n=1 Tax=Devosia riboflavina TaxID=46914 RepID=A0A087LYA9_9HYPH|nr:hypothetical protein JP75_19830 [Devosia riboflavina]
MQGFSLWRVGAQGVALLSIVIPAQAGIHLEISGWAPAFAGVTSSGGVAGVIPAFAGMTPCGMAGAQGYAPAEGHDY